MFCLNCRDQQINSKARGHAFKSNGIYLRAGVELVVCTRVGLDYE